MRRANRGRRRNEPQLKHKVEYSNKDLNTLRCFNCQGYGLKSCNCPTPYPTQQEKHPRITKWTVCSLGLQPRREMETAGAGQSIEHINTQIEGDDKPIMTYQHNVQLMVDFKTPPKLTFCVHSVNVTFLVDSDAEVCYQI